METLSNMTDPFDGDLYDLVNISNAEMATASVSNDLLKCHEIGEKKFEEFVSQKVKLTKRASSHRYQRQILKPFRKNILAAK